MPGRPLDPRGSERTQRGVVFPSPVVVLSIVAVAMAAIAFVATRGAAPDEREVATTVRQEQTTAPVTPSAEPEREDRERERRTRKPPVERASVFVEVYNNSGITGLASTAGEEATAAGWNVVGTDNWYGSIPSNTVYFPERLEREAKQLALDLGVGRTAPAVGAMRLDRLTLILTGAL